MQNQVLVLVSIRSGRTWAIHQLPTLGKDRAKYFGELIGQRVQGTSVHCPCPAQSADSDNDGKGDLYRGTEVRNVIPEIPYRS